jgi:hypothetical protein
MPQERLKKIFAEFRTSEERQMLHEIMVRIGELPPRVVEGPDS